MLQRIRKSVYNRLVKPLALLYIRKDRDVFWYGIRIRVSRGVFHPSLYFSTRFLLKYLLKQQLKGKTFLEIGAGSGLISIWAALEQAVVTATDISDRALADIRHNASLNRAHLTVLKSDLWYALPPKTYQWIVVNPPYFPRYPATEADRAWYCGENFEYFHGFFQGLGAHMQADTQVLMVLSQDCEIEKIREIALESGFVMEIVQQGMIWGEMNYVYRISRKFGFAGIV